MQLSHLAQTCNCIDEQLPLQQVLAQPAIFYLVASCTQAFPNKPYAHLLAFAWGKVTEYCVVINFFIWLYILTHDSQCALHFVVACYQFRAMWSAACLSMSLQSPGGIRCDTSGFMPFTHAGCFVPTISGHFPGPGHIGSTSG